MKPDPSTATPVFIATSSLSRGEHNARIDGMNRSLSQTLAIGVSLAAVALITIVLLAFAWKKSAAQAARLDLAKIVTVGTVRNSAEPSGVALSKESGQWRARWVGFGDDGDLLGNEPNLSVDVSDETAARLFELADAPPEVTQVIFRVENPLAWTTSRESFDEQTLFDMGLAVGSKDTQWSGGWWFGSR